MPDLGSTQLTMLWASLLLGFVYLLAAAVTSVGKRGMTWAAGPRDEPGAPIGTVGGRLDRAWKNYLETLPMFVGAVFIETLAGLGSALAALGAQLFFWGRVAYLPLYVSGWPYLRTVAWNVAIVGILLLLLACLPGL